MKTSAKKQKKLARPDGSRLSTMMKGASKAVLANRKRGEALLALIERRKGRITEDFFDIGEALRELRQPRVYRAMEYASFEELLAARRVMGRTQAYKLIHIVSSFSREQALALGAEKAFAVIGYAGATSANDLPRQILEAGTIAGRPIAKLSVRDIRAAGEKLRARREKLRPLSKEAREAQREARAWQETLRKSGARTATVVAEERQGRWWLVASVPLDERAPS